MGDGGIDVPFNVLMQQAVKLKTAQQQIDRRKYDSWPKFYQHSMFAKDDIKHIRTLPFSQRLSHAQKLKEHANSLLTNGSDGLNASFAYENALSVFKYVLNTDSNWKNKGIDDCTIVEYDFESDIEEEVTQVNEFKISCYLNLARCYMSINDYKSAIEACDEAIKVDFSCDKAYFIKSRALVTPASSGATEHEFAMKCLEKAYKCLQDKMQMIEHFDESGQKNIQTRFNEVSRELRQMRMEKQQQKEKDKQWKNVFNRYEKENDNLNERITKTTNEMDEEKKNDTECNENKVKIEELERQLDQAQYLAQVYEKEGRFKDADILREGIKETNEKINKIRNSKSTNKLNFRDPTKEMIEDAASRGIDLNDPRVIDLLEEIQEGTENGTFNSEKEFDELDERDEKFINLQERLKMKEMHRIISSLTLKEMVESLDELGIDSSKCENRQQLEVYIQNRIF